MTVLKSHRRGHNKKFVILATAIMTHIYECKNKWMADHPALLLVWSGRRASNNLYYQKHKKTHKTLKRLSCKTFLMATRSLLSHSLAW